MAGKPKLNLDTQKIKHFLVQHGEKIVLGLFGLIFLMLLYKSFGLERVTQTPQDLSRVVQEARQKLDRAQFNPEEEGIVVKEYAEKAKQVTRKVAISGRTWKPVRPPIWPPGNKRGQPLLLVVEDVQAFGGLGLFDLKAESLPGAARTPAAEPQRDGRNPAERGEAPSPPSPRGGSTAGPGDGLRYVVVLGLVPVGRQTKAYQEAFHNVAAPQEGDQKPRYKGVWVQRAVAGPPDDELQWIAIDKENAKLKERLGKATEELAADNVVDPVLTEPLPRLLEGEWEPRLVVHDKTPMRVKREQRVVVASQDAAPQGPMLNVGPIDPLAEQPAEPTSPAPTNQPTGETQKEDEPKESPNLLFRYFDFTAQPGVAYKYRVYVALENPNFGVDPQHLEDPKLGAKKFVWSPPSNATEPAVAPLGGELFAGETKISVVDSEVVALLALEQWMPSGGHAQQIVPAHRGRVANFELKEPVMLTRGKSEPEFGSQPVQVRTETALLDIHPNGKVADLLLLDASGRLQVRKGENDLARFEEIEKNVEGAARARRNKKDNKEAADHLKVPDRGDQNPAAKPTEGARRASRRGGSEN